MREIKIDWVDTRIGIDYLTQHLFMPSTHVHQCVYVFESIVKSQVITHLLLCEGCHGWIEDVVELWIASCVRTVISSITTRILEIVIAMKYTLMKMVPRGQVSGVFARE
jgi:hypothetical protein